MDLKQIFDSTQKKINSKADVKFVYGSLIKLKANQLFQ